LHELLWFAGLFALFRLFVLRSRSLFAVPPRTSPHSCATLDAHASHWTTHRHTRLHYSPPGSVHTYITLVGTYRLVTVHAPRFTRLFTRAFSCTFLADVPAVLTLRSHYVLPTHAPAPHGSAHRTATSRTIGCVPAFSRLFYHTRHTTPLRRSLFKDSWFSFSFLSFRFFSFSSFHFYRSGSVRFVLWFMVRSHYTGCVRSHYTWFWFTRLGSFSCARFALTLVLLAVRFTRKVCRSFVIFFSWFSRFHTGCVYLVYRFCSTFTFPVSARTALRRFTRFTFGCHTTHHAATTFHTHVAVFTRFTFFHVLVRRFTHAPRLLFYHYATLHGSIPRAATVHFHTLSSPFRFLFSSLPSDFLFTLPTRSPVLRCYVFSLFTAASFTRVLVCLPLFASRSHVLVLRTVLPHRCTVHIFTLLVIATARFVHSARPGCIVHLFTLLSFTRISVAFRFVHVRFRWVDVLFGSFVHSHIHVYIIRITFWFLAVLSLPGLLMKI